MPNSAKRVHANSVDLAASINAAVVAAGKSVVTPAKPMHFNRVDIAKQIKAATGQAVVLNHEDSASIAKAIEASIALMP